MIYRGYSHLTSERWRVSIVMAFVHPTSCECSKSELYLFNVPATQTAIDFSQWVEHKPLTSLTDSAPVEFVITGSGEEYVDLSETYIQVTAQITKSDGGDLITKNEDETDGEDIGIGPVNNWLHSLFSQVDMSLNGRLITASTNTYAYRSYLENLLTYGPAAKKSHLTSSLWYKDTAGHMDSVNAENEGFTQRRKWIQNSRFVTMIGRPHLDLCFQDRLMLNGVDMKMRFVRSKDAFNLMGTGKVVIKDMSLFVRKVKVHPSVQLGHIKALDRATAKYPVKRVETKVFSIPKNNMSANQENLFLGQLPNRIVIGLVENSAFSGSRNQSPFHFKHFDTDFLALYLDGMQVPSKPLQPDFEKENHMRSYVSLFSGTGLMCRDQGNDISRDEYGNGYTLFAFDLTPDLSDAGHFQLVKHGNLRLELHFKTQLPVTVNAIVYAEFENVIEIDKARNVLFDYSA